MTKTKKIMVSLTKDDLLKFNTIAKYLKEKHIQPKDSELMKMALREYYDTIKKELVETYKERDLID